MKKKEEARELLIYLQDIEEESREILKDLTSSSSSFDLQYIAVYLSATIMEEK